MNIEKILEEIYLFDPSLCSKEPELKEVIEKLLENKPDAAASPGFREKLMSELSARMEEKKTPVGFFVMHRKAIVGAAGFAAALVVILTFAVRPGLVSNVMSPDRMLATESTAGYGSLPEQEKDPVQLESAVVSEAPMSVKEKSLTAGAAPSADYKRRSEAFSASEQEADLVAADEEVFIDAGNSLSGEEYRAAEENRFIPAEKDPLSTFSIDVDTASYANVRRFLQNGTLPPADAVRIEELVNYFSYDYPQPESGEPFSFTCELAECPWNKEHLLLHIGLKGYEVQKNELPPANLVFLIDSSGSMSDENKLPLLIESISLLVDNLREEDRVSIVAYAGSAGIVLPPTPGNNKAVILQALETLSAGGSTAGGAGIDLAYKTAESSFLINGNNRVIIASDGDFNVGQSSAEELKTLIEGYRDKGICLTVLGLGMYNYRDARMEALADNGNGNYSYIDTINEANKVLVTEMSSTVLTIAKDVKIQVNFNPEAVESYRLTGYENRVMSADDFSDDRKDAGEIGAGHSVTVLYELIPVKKNPDAQPLAEIKFRYKTPGEQQSRLIQFVIDNRYGAIDDSTDNFRFSAAVAEWGLILKGSQYRGSSEIDDVIKLAKNSMGPDPYGYRKEFLELLYRTSVLLQN